MLKRVLALPEMRCDMNIQRFRDRWVNSRTKPVQVAAIGNEQIRFVTDLLLPAQERFVLGFRLSFRQQTAFGEGTVAAVEEAPCGSGCLYTVALTKRSAEDERWRRMVDCVFAVQQEQFASIERLYGYWLRADAGSCRINARL
jgi:hypothetical protein